MTEEEYIDTLKRGESTAPPSGNSYKMDGRAPSTAKATAGNPPSTKNEQRKGRKVVYIKTDVQHCQSTSS
jgi:hypothetical protein